MSYDISVFTDAVEEPGAPAVREFAPLQIGRATVFIEQSAATPTVVGSDVIYPAGAPSPADAFQHGAAALRECVSAIGDCLHRLAAEHRPKDVEVEFSLSFEAGAKGIIPVLVTAEQKVHTGLKVKAKWELHPSPAQQ